MNGPGEWFAKGFGLRPFGKYPGQGCNLLFNFKTLVRQTRFACEMHRSQIDGRPSYLGYYAAFNNYNSGNGMTNDIRKVEYGLYLSVNPTDPGSTTVFLLISGLILKGGDIVSHGGNEES